MRDLNTLNHFRLRHPAVLQEYGSYGDDKNGVFQIPSGAGGPTLQVIVFTEDGWEAVNVSTPDRVPTWQEMKQVKDLFFKENEIAMQLYMPDKHPIHKQPNCLHLWRPTRGLIPTPPEILI